MEHRVQSGTGAMSDAFDSYQDQIGSYREKLTDVEQLIAATGDLPWEQADAVGEGEEYRAESEHGDHASALAFEDTVVHESLMAAV